MTAASNILIYAINTPAVTFNTLLEKTNLMINPDQIIFLHSP